MIYYDDKIRPLQASYKKTSNLINSDCLLDI